MLMKSQNRNGFGSFFVAAALEINKKNIKKIEKNNRGLGKIRHTEYIKTKYKKGEKRNGRRADGVFQK